MNRLLLHSRSGIFALRDAAVEKFLDDVSKDIEERRNSFRIYSDEEVETEFDEEVMPSRFVNKSDHGARVLVVDGLKVGCLVNVPFNDYTQQRAKCVWVKSNEARLSFAEAATATAQAA